MKHVTVYTDGGARGNPGIAGAGAVAYNNNGELIFELSEYLGDDKTNNYAEYTAIIMALTKLIEMGLIDTSLELKADSKLAIEQLSGRWKVKDAGIKLLYAKTVDLLRHFTSVKLTHIPREQNKHADMLANKAMDLGKSLV